LVVVGVGFITLFKVYKTARGYDAVVPIGRLRHTTDITDGFKAADETTMSARQLSYHRAYVLNNGKISAPLKVFQNADGTYEVFDGNHRLYIAVQLGLVKLPIKIFPKPPNIPTK
jgi:hypothetical protein